MGRTDNQQIAKETLSIIKNGYYEIDNQKYELEYSNKSYEEVMVFTPDEVRAINEDEDEFFERAFYGHSFCEYSVVNMDSFEANEALASGDNALVMNFANAHHPGGGFINGASAQEESLCRCSTLFASINSEAAKEMYDYNNQNRNAFDSDYMLISPCVEVFRHVSGELMYDSFVTAVLTIPAPNLHGLARNVNKNEVRKEMKEKIRRFLMVAARKGYDTLILGAWGCGAFGHDAEDVAGYFADILEGEEYYQFFQKIIFAVYDSSPEKYNYKAFLEYFGEHGIWKDDDCEATVIQVEFAEGTVNEEGAEIYREEVVLESNDALKELMEEYLNNKAVKRIEIIR